jgi:hypothetical protein
MIVWWISSLHKGTSLNTVTSSNTITSHRTYIMENTHIFSLQADGVTFKHITKDTLVAQISRSIDSSSKLTGVSIDTHTIILVKGTYFPFKNATKGYTPYILHRKADKDPGAFVTRTDIPVGIVPYTGMRGHTYPCAYVFCIKKGTEGTFFTKGVDGTIKTFFTLDGGDPVVSVRAPWKPVSVDDLDIGAGSIEVDDLIT